MEKYKYGITLISSVIAFIALATSNFYHLLFDETWSLFSKERIYRELLCGNSGYFCIGVHVFILSIICILALEYCLKKEELLFLIRSDSRKQFYIRRINLLLPCVLVISTAYYSVGFGSIGLFFNFKFIFSQNTLAYIIAKFSMSYLYLFRLGIIYICLRDFTGHKMLSAVVVLLLVITEFSIDSFVFEGIYFLYEDLSIGEQYFISNTFPPIHFLLAVVRQAGSATIIAIIGIKCYERKDVILLEE